MSGRKPSGTADEEAHDHQGVGEIEAEALAQVKGFVEKAKQPLGDSTFERAVNVEIEDFKVPFPKVSEHEIVPLENRTTVWGKSGFLARLVELDLF